MKLRLYRIKKIRGDMPLDPHSSNNWCLHIDLSLATPLVVTTVLLILLYYYTYMRAGLPSVLILITNNISVPNNC